VVGAWPWPSRRADLTLELRWELAWIWPPPVDLEDDRDRAAGYLKSWLIPQCYQARPARQALPSGRLWLMGSSDSTVTRIDLSPRAP